MATYKVPQDVEAEDKLLGPFTFRQFIYLLIVAMAGAMAWGLAQIFVGLAIIPLPVILFFGALALPLRKDQPMEIYLAAIVSFYLKPRLRLWDPDGTESLIEISAPKTVEKKLTKDLSQDEAQQRLSYLAHIVDSQGWAIRGIAGVPGTAVNNDIYLEAQGAEDVLDTNTQIAHTFDQMMSATTERMHEAAKQRMLQTNVEPVPPAVAPAAPAIPTAAPPLPPAYAPPAPATPEVVPQFNPYPTIHQSVIQPLGDTAHQAPDTALPTTPQSVTPTPSEPKVEEKPTSTSDSIVTADIINLANNPDLSIETIAHEAERIKKKAAEDSDEVVISLR